MIDETPSEQVVKDETTKQDSNNTANMQVNTFSDVKLRRPNTPARSQSFDTNRQRMNGTNQTNENVKIVKNANNHLDSKANVPKEKIVDQRNGSQNDRKTAYNYREITTATTSKQEQKMSVSIVTTDEGLDFRKVIYLLKTNFNDVEIIVLIE